MYMYVYTHTNMYLRAFGYAAGLWPSGLMIVGKALCL